MKEILDRIGSYNIFNFLLPGVIFSVFASQITSYNLVQSDVLVGSFTYYFIGLVVSRVGSLAIEPILKKLGIVKFSSYPDFVAASKEDPKIEVLSETNNMYRTLCSLALCLAVVYGYDKVAHSIECVRAGTPAIGIISLAVLFVLSYRKQTAYIEMRVSANNK